MIINALKSARLAQWLIVSLLLVLLLSIFIPQKAIYSASEIASFARGHPIAWKAASALSLTDIFTSPLFISLAAALALNLTFCIGRRAVKIFLPEIARFGPPPSAGAVEKTQHRPSRPAPAAHIRLRFLGSTIFHIGILAAMAGLLASKLAGFAGEVVVTEGQSVADRHETYGTPLEGALFLEGHGMFSVKLERVVRRFSPNGNITGLTALAKVEDGGKYLRKHVRANRPLEYGGASFVIKEDGFSPLFTLRDKRTGRKVFSSYVNIKTYAKCTNDSFSVPAAGLRVDTGFAAQRKKERAAVFGPAGLALFVRVVQPANAAGGIEKILYAGPLIPGKSVGAGGYELSVDDVRSWIKFKVIRDPGKMVVFTGFWACAAGLALRFYGGGVFRQES